MKTRTLKAIKPHKYGTRHLTAGEEYEAPPRHAFALVAARKAQFADKKQLAPQEQAAAEFVEHLHPTESIEPIGGDEPKPESTLDDLRLRATALGINVDGRWGRARLQYEIEQAQR